MNFIRALNHFVGRGIQTSNMLCTRQLRSISQSCLVMNNMQVRLYSSAQSSDNSIQKTDNNATNQPQVGFTEVVKENTKSAWYLSIIAIGIGVTATMFYAIFRELFSSRSANNIYTKALERCMTDTRIVDALGAPIKGYGEETRRGRRGHVRHSFYEKDGIHHVKMQFYIQGIRKRGVVHLDMQEDESGTFVYRYLFVQLEDMVKNVIILEDNRYLETHNVNNINLNE